MVERSHIISLDIHQLSFNESLEMVLHWAIDKRSAYTCFANVHMTIEAHNNSVFREKVNAADLVLADGKPIAIACNLLYHKKQERICGMDFTPLILERANEKRLSVFVYGSTIDVLTAFEKKLKDTFQDIIFAGSILPPFRKLTEEEIKKDIDIINRSGAHIVLVALGCPKQETWMTENSDKINAVLLGIGGALDVFAGKKKRAPKWMQNMSLEWFYRLIQQPGRLFTRYLYTNSFFLILLSKEWIKKLLKRS